MKRARFLLTLFILLPSLAHAQSFQSFFKNGITFINKAVIPFVLGVGFLIFIINVIRYFVIGAGNDDSREKARSLAIYSVFGFVIIFVFWGIVNLITSSIGLEGQKAPPVDYVKLNS